MNQPKTALLFGATGLVGHFLLEELLADERYAVVNVFGRRKMGREHPKLQQHLIDFTKPESFAQLLTGDEVFCCLGTTIRTAGSQEAFRQVDFDAPLAIAKAAKANGVKTYVLISSMGANPKSRNFYQRVKGEVEQAIAAKLFDKLVIVRPSMLLGPRKEFRLGERIGKVVMIGLGFLVPARYKAIEAQTVARAMVYAANDDALKGVLLSDKLREIGK